MSTKTPALRIRQAKPDESGLVADVLAAAAAKVRARGELIWEPSEVSEEAVAGDVGAGMYYVAFDEKEAVGVFRFQLEDPGFWPEIAQGSSAYVHKLAVYPDRQGREVAQLLLAHACELARQLGRRHLRLDCAGGKPRLRAVYERFGFRHHSEKRIGDIVFDRFELAIDPS